MIKLQWLKNWLARVGLAKSKKQLVSPGISVTETDIYTVPFRLGDDLDEWQMMEGDRRSAFITSDVESESDDWDDWDEQGEIQTYYNAQNSQNWGNYILNNQNITWKIVNASSLSVAINATNIYNLGSESDDLDDYNSDF